MNSNIENIKNTHKVHPEFEDQWIKRLEEKLPKRGEENILLAIKSGYNEMKSDVLTE